MNVAQIDIAIRMLRDKKFTINGRSSEDEVEAAAWIFDTGILMQGQEFTDKIIKMLEERKQALSAHG